MLSLREAEAVIEAYPASLQFISESVHLATSQ